MRRMTTVVFLITLAGLIYGCQPPAANDGGGTESAEPSSDSSASLSPASDATQLSLIRGQDPVQTVKEFLHALRAGDTAKVTAMLSVKAQQQTAAHNMAISPPGNPTAQFFVDPENVLEPGDGTTLVLSNWTDVDANGVKQTYDVGWMLKQDNGGLAVTGMATRVFEDSDNLILDFEDPPGMMLARKNAEQEIARRRQQQQQSVARDQNGRPVVR